MTSRQTRFISEASLWQPTYIVPSAWIQHAPFGFWIIDALRPRTLVELGTHFGFSYSVFLQAIQSINYLCKCTAIDTWKGDEHSGFYGPEVLSQLRQHHDGLYNDFSDLLQSTFDDAAKKFDSCSIDLLHIDGRHYFDDAKHDFELWLPKMSKHGVVILHDTRVSARDFGVYRLWNELATRYPSIEFSHGHGLGVLGIGDSLPSALSDLLALREGDPDHALVLRLYRQLGERVSSQIDAAKLVATMESELQARSVALQEEVIHRDALMGQRDTAIHSKDSEIQNLQQQIHSKDSEIQNLQQQIHSKDSEIQNLQQQIHSKDSAIQNLQQQIHSKDSEIQQRDRHVAFMSRAAEQTRHELDATRTQLQSEKGQREQSQEKLHKAERRLEIIENSTVWRATSFLRDDSGRQSAVTRWTRRLLRGIWWTVSLQLLSRLRARRRLFRARRMIAASDLFDATWYLQQYPDVAAAGWDPALHYALFGASEGRNPSPRFDSRWYIGRHDDVAKFGINPLVHFLEFGAEEGREIRSVQDGEESSAEAPVVNDDYSVWVERYDTLTEADRHAIRLHIAALPETPLISVLMPVYNTVPEYLHKAIDSVLAQLYPHWELCITDDASTDPAIRPILEEYARRESRIKVVYRPENGHISAASNSALQLVTGEFLALIDHDDELPIHALYMVAVELNAHSDADIIYSDEDKIGADGQLYGPYFKTDWNPELFYSQNMINHLGVYRTSLVRQVGGFREGFEGSQDYDLVLRLLARTAPDRIRHIPFVLYHWRLGDGVQTFSTDRIAEAVRAAHRALADYFVSRGERVKITASEVPYWNRVIRPLPDPPPRVSLVVPTRDMGILLRNCVEGLLHRTRYPNLEIIIVDNNSRDPSTLEYLARLSAEERVRILRIDEPFNYAAFNNRAAEKADGEIIAFVNNDIEVIDPGWLEEMVSQVLQPGVGAVGAKLYYHNDTIQHAGVVLGMHGVAAHGHRGFPRSATGYYGRLQLVQNVSCVTAACMVVLKSVFVEVGGFDEINLKVSYNDVDLCLKIREAGYAIVWTPYAELYHLESASRGSDLEQANAQRARREYAYMRHRWSGVLDNDPFYSPNLSLQYENCSLAFPPRTIKPWTSVCACDRSDDSRRQRIQQAQSEWSTFGRNRLQELLLVGSARLLFPCPKYPILSVIVVFRNEAHLSLLCLESLRQNADVSYELIIVDNGSNNETQSLLDRIDGATVLRNPSNVGFGPACMQAVESARGEYLCFLNNDVLLQPKGLSAGLDTLINDQTVAGVGGKILLANGDLQEAGSILWSDGTALGYGRGDNPDLARYNFRRPVDFCSGAFLFTPRTVFRELGGFSSKYSPAYYEDADYCMQLWCRGFQVIYEPRAVVRHYESASSGNNDGARTLMATKQAVFVSAWDEALQTRHVERSPENIFRARFAAAKQNRHVVYMEDAVPHRHLGAGYPRSNAILHEIVRQGYRVTCATSTSPPGSHEYVDLPLEVELLDASNGVAELEHYLANCDLVWISRPNNMEKYLRQIITKKPNRKYKVIYDAEAIFAEREYLQCLAEGQRLPAELLETWIARELRPAMAADRVVCVSSRDAERMASAGILSPVVIGYHLETKPSASCFHQRGNFLFVGRMHGGRDPNTDSMQYFCERVWPGLRSATGAELIIAGMGTEMFAEKEFPGVRTLGTVENLTELYGQARVFVVPTRYAAGVPLKMYEAASFGLPAVVSTLIGEQLGWNHDEECLVAGTPAEFVDCCSRLYFDETLWNRLRTKSLQRIEADLNWETFADAVRDVLEI